MDSSITTTASRNIAIAPMDDLDQHGHEDTPSSVESTPEPGADAPTQDPSRPKKRKGGRKPIYATSAERKQRNRQAQAAFRERRTEYIKQLEANIKQNEESMRSLQQSQRSAADECLMLRYKNSLLERILLEKGIDVQAELQAKTGSPVLDSTHFSAHAPSQSMSQPALQRAAVSRQHARRSNQSMNQRAPAGSGQVRRDSSFSVQSPQGQPTPSSHASSPTATSARSSSSVQHGGMTPPTSAIMAQPPSMHYRPIQARPRLHYLLQQSGPSQSIQPGFSRPSSLSTDASIPGTTMGGPGAAAYPSPYQKQMDHLDHEYHAPHQPDEFDNEPNGQRSFAPDASPDQYQMQQDQFRNQFSANSAPDMSPRDMIGGTHVPFADGVPQQDANAPYPNISNILDIDPMLDADPFGLSASMHFHTNYSFDQPQQR